MLIFLKGYKNLKKISAGINTSIYRGERIQDSQTVEIAIFPSQQISAIELNKLRHQYIVTHNLNLNGVVKIYVLENFGNGWAIIREDFAGISWREYATIKNPQNLPRQQLTEFFPIALQIVEILEQLAQNQIIHQKISPQTILISPDTKQVKLTDFSCASLLPKHRQLWPNSLWADDILPYISPEQTGLINRGLDYRTDFYSLGVTFYQILTGQVPFAKSNPHDLVYAHLAGQPIPPRKVNSAIPVMLSKLILKLMAKNPEKRYYKALGLRQDLEKCQQQWQNQNKITTY